MQRVNGDWNRLKGIDCEIRGFEGYQSTESHRALRSRRRTVVHQVLKVQHHHQQQKLQQQQNYQNHSCTSTSTTEIQKKDQEMAIAQCSRNESFQSQELAYQMGLKDEQVAQMAWREFFAEPEEEDDVDDEDDDDPPIESDLTTMEEDSISNTGFLEMGDLLDLMELDDE